MSELISNDALALEHLPPPGAKWQPALRELAATFDGYVQLGSQGALAGIANPALKRFKQTGEVPLTLLELRACLFFEYRRAVHQAEDPDDHPELMRYLHAVVEAMRTILARRT